MNPNRGDNPSCVRHLLEDGRKVTLELTDEQQRWAHQEQVRAVLSTGTFVFRDWVAWLAVYFSVSCIFCTHGLRKFGTFMSFEASMVCVRFWTF